MTWENYELVQEFEAPDGEVHRMLVRAVAVPDSVPARFLGIVADVSDPGEVPWITADVGERLTLLVEHSPDAIIVHQDGLVVYTNPAGLRMGGVKSLDAAIGQAHHLVHQPRRPHEHDRPPGPAERPRRRGEGLRGHDGARRRQRAARRGGQRPHELGRQARLPGHPARRLGAQARRGGGRGARRDRTPLRGGGGRARRGRRGHRPRRARWPPPTTRPRGSSGPRSHAGHGDEIFTGGRRAVREDGAPFPPDALPLAVALARREATTNVVIGVRDEHGKDQWLSVSSRPLGDSEGADNATVVCSVSDITDRKQLLDRLAWEARNDPLTGLANRSGFLTAVQGAIENSDAATLQSLVMFFFDLDRFKLVNDSLGHAVGDEVLLAVAERLRATMPDVISLSRLHGDEFAALEPNVTDTDAALQRAEELRTILSRPVQLSTGPHVVGDPEHRAGAPGRCRPRSVRRPPGRGHGHAPGQDHGAAAAWPSSTPGCAKRWATASSSSTICAPRWRTASCASSTSRWRRSPTVACSASRPWCAGSTPAGACSCRRASWAWPRSPSSSWPSVGWVLEAGCAQMARWRAMYPEATDSFLAVNVSPRQLDGQQLLPALRSALEKSGLPAGALMLEITESGLVSDDGHLNGMLEELREFGVRLAIDDFGTGYSSLSHLKRLPVSYIKIDRSFVSGLGTDAEDERIVAAITELGHGLGLRVIAEGVENRQQRHVARQLGCDLYQGYLLAEPRRPRDIPAFWRPRPVRGPRRQLTPTRSRLRPGRHHRRGRRPA